MSVFLLLVYLVVFVVVPLWLGWRVASSHGKSPWLGLLIALLFSYLGVLVMWLIWKDKPATARA